jgi:predicted ATPase
VPTLVLLDNVEHVVACAPQLRSLLEQCPGLTILATSRVLLRVRGEHEFGVGPLPVPADATAGFESVASSAAVQLFVARAQEINAGFALHAGNAPDVAEVCRRLDGLPLAIELAAARTRLLSPAALLARLSSRLDVLSDGAADLPERQRTLRATIEWSLNLLDHQQQERFAQLAVFVGGWDVDAAAAVWQVDDGEALDHLSVLLDSSLITAVPGGTDVRFRMLQTLQTFAGERLEQSGAAAEAQARHAHWIVAQSRGANRGLQGPDGTAWVQRYDENFENLRAAMEWLLANDEIAAVAQVGWELFVYWWQQARVREASVWLKAALGRADVLDPLTRARLLWSVGGMAGQMGELDLARRHLAEARQLLIELGDDEGLGACLLLLSPDVARRGDLDEADALATQAAELLGAHRNELGYAVALEVRGAIAMVHGRLDDSRRFHQAAREAALRLGNRPLIAQTSNQMGFVELWAGDMAAGKTLLDEGLRGYLAVNNAEGIALSLEGYATIALAQGDHRRSGLALAHAALLRERIGLPVWGVLEAAFEATHAEIRQALGDDEYAAVMREGRAMTRQEAIAAAVGAASVNAGPPA